MLARAGPLRGPGARELLRPRTYGEYQKEFNQLVERALELGEFAIDAPPEPGHEAAELARADSPRPARTALQQACMQAIRGGKRLRPILLMEIRLLRSNWPLQPSELTAKI